MRTFYAVLANALAGFVTNTFVWFAVTFWVYLETKSVVATSVMAGVYTGTVAISGFFLGSLVDRYKKKTAMLLSSMCSLLLYAIACIIYISTPPQTFTDAANPLLWLFVILALVFTVAGLIGLAVTLFAMRSRSYRVLSHGTQTQSLEAGFVEAST